MSLKVEKDSLLVVVFSARIKSEGALQSVIAAHCSASSGDKVEFFDRTEKARTAAKSKTDAKATDIQGLGDVRISLDR